MIKDVILSQYLATLAMLEQAITQCPPALWTDPAPKNAFWHIAYHAMFYTYLYAHASEADFQPWPGQQPDAHVMGKKPYPPFDEPEIARPSTPAELGEFLTFIRRRLPELLAACDLHGPSGFAWLPMNKLELQFYNLRHLQQHVGELCERLFEGEDISVEWVGMTSVDDAE